MRIPLQYVELPGLSFGTGLSSKIAILTTLFRKNVNIGVQILPTVQDFDVLDFKIQINFPTLCSLDYNGGLLGSTSGSCEEETCASRTIGVSQAAAKQRPKKSSFASTSSSFLLGFLTQTPRQGGHGGECQLGVHKWALFIITTVYLARLKF